MLITVLGASGFIGSAVTAELARGGARLRTVSRRPADLPAAEHRTADLTEPGRTAEAVAGSDVVVQLAAELSGPANWRAAGDGPAARLMTDLVGALAARGGQPPVVLFASTVPPSGPGAPTPYERGKRAAERVLERATAEGAVRGISLRLPTVYGPATGPATGAGAAGRGVVSAMARRAAAGEPVTLWHDGTVRRDLLYVRDAATAFAAALAHADALAGTHWDVGTGRSLPLGEVFHALAGAVAARTGRPPVPVLRVQAPPYAAAADFRDVTADPAPFRTATGWAPRVPLPEGLARTAAALTGGTPGKDDRA
ncbi:NAD-dependent epimerase/dehydratase [Streptomyces venezuelae]|uniref:NAD-dependent epimerase/dehydratase n=1 Tax=Streptomyces venezuelae TaxID=54571 RepID=A0A5P2D214_STRVZ|nr:NAD-dependent epimerase/dehydratase family protein [Streptomyces venezuelae]QES48793.1 NAD-dependent epimerase/dehydratase [Streptomyces venezuelae]